MYAIIKSGGKQYRVKEGDVIDVELLNTEDTHIELKDILYFNDGNDSKVGSPAVSGYVVKAEILGQVAGPKIVSVKYKRSHNVRKKFGHRQDYTRLKITGLGKEGQESGDHKEHKPHKAPSKKSQKQKEDAE